MHPLHVTRGLVGGQIQHPGEGLAGTRIELRPPAARAVPGDLRPPVLARRPAPAELRLGPLLSGPGFALWHACPSQVAAWLSRAARGDLR
jgi:hypothetical protein